jgi:REP element-mobilizing transposase RayT
MTHSYRVHFFHWIWSTQGRRQWIVSDVQQRLYSYVGGIVRNYEGSLIEIGGMPDHVHLLIKLNNLDTFSSLIRDVKAHSSLWVHKNFTQLKDFAWQEGYASYSVSYSGLAGVQGYIQTQEKHHQTMSFEEEYLKFLNLHKTKYDERFVLDKPFVAAAT